MGSSLMTWCLNMPASQMAPWHPNDYRWLEPALGRPQELGLASWWGSPTKSQSQLQGYIWTGSVLRHPYTLYTSSWGNRTSDSEKELKEKGFRGFHRGTEQKCFSLPVRGTQVEPCIFWGRPTVLPSFPLSATCSSGGWAPLPQLFHVLF